jgi:hypothetical protein
MPRRANPAKRKPRRHNPAATALRTPAYRPRVVKSKKVYVRKGRPRQGGPDVEASDD